MRRPSLAMVFVVLAVLASACAGERGPDFTIGFKRLALNLAYKDDKLPEYVTPGSVAIPSEVQFLAPTFLIPKAPTLPTQPRIACPEADPDARPAFPATVFVTKPPAVGAYTTHLTGFVELGVAPPVRVPLPSRGGFEIRNVQKTFTDDDPLNGYTEIITYDLFTPSLDGGTTASYRVTYSPATLVGTATQAATIEKAAAGEMALTHLVIDTTDTKLDFTPDPPVTIMAFRSGQGTSWNSAGIDRASGTAMVVSGSVTRRVNVDLCGKVYDTYEVVSNEHIVNLETGFRSDTDAQDPNVYRVATNYGGLFIQAHRHVTTSVTKPNGDVSSYVVNYDETFDAIGPQGAQ